MVRNNIYKRRSRGFNIPKNYFRVKKSFFEIDKCEMRVKQWFSH